MRGEDKMSVGRIASIANAANELIKNKTSQTSDISKTASPKTPHIMLNRKTAFPNYSTPEKSTYTPAVRTAADDYTANTLGTNNRAGFSTNAEVDNALKDYNANVAVRKRMVEDGFLNDQIGWNSKTNNITYYGKDIGVPGRLEDGTSYMTQDEYDKMINNTTKDNVLLTDYASSRGIGNGVTYNNDGTVTLYGQSLPVHQIKSDGFNNYAYVKKSDVDRIYNEYQMNNPTSMAAYNGLTLYNKKINEAADKVSNRPSFSYDLESDPAYKAYYEAAVRNGEDAYEDILARNAAMTGGFANSNAIMAAAQARNAHLDTLNDRIPQLYQAAYERYNQDYQNDLNALSALNSTASNVFANELQAAAYIDQLMNNNYSRKNAEYNKLLQKDATAYERQMYEDEAENNRLLNAANLYLQLLGATENPSYIPYIQGIASTLR